MELTYPPGPAVVPDNLTRATRAYRRRTWLALAGLALFALLYFTLSLWFLTAACRALSALATGQVHVRGLIGGLCAGVLAFFMLRALFVVRVQESEDIEIGPAEQPQLFAFLTRLAAEAGAPPPHRVYLSGRVNAAVSYDRGPRGMLPARKNLEIGLALVNVLTLGELKAVLAHELGHFAQRTMALGRWVHVAQQVAGHLVARRDALQAFLQRLSGRNLRIAWIAWLSRLILWSIRAWVDVVFRGVVIAHNALAREMELQADLVAVALTGSDALVHALYRLPVADEAWERALSFARTEQQQGRRVGDLFALQTRVIERLPAAIGNPQYGQVPPAPPEKRESHRVFQAQLVQPPRMWLSHPSCAEREENCKRRYVAASIDARSAWTLFANVQALKERISAHVLGSTDQPHAELAGSLARLDEQFGRAYLDGAYRGVYVGRSVARHARIVQELYGTLPEPRRITAELRSLYPPRISVDLQRLRALEAERDVLKAVEEAAVKSPGGLVRYRGRDLRCGELTATLVAVRAQIDRLSRRLGLHDRRCRTVHRAAAAGLGGGWEGYLVGLAGVLHYADHAEANLLDARAHLASVLAAAVADDRVRPRDIDEVLGAADCLHEALLEIDRQRESVVLDRTLTRRLAVESWCQRIAPCTLPRPVAQDIGEWLRAVDDWVASYAGALSALRLAALDQLLLAEAQVARFARQRMTPAEAPPPAQAPEQYSTLVPGSERPRAARRGGWERSASAALAMAARLAAAASLIGGLLALTTMAG
jgi:Zn-dependent protease with chaperone function